MGKGPIARPPLLMGSGGISPDTFKNYRTSFPVSSEDGSLIPRPWKGSGNREADLIASWVGT